MKISIFVEYAGMIRTTRPTHYHVLFDEVGFSADDPQELVHSLSYAYQTSTIAVYVYNINILQIVIF
jgi:eukaryotic translation initiation factor 2C